MGPEAPGKEGKMSKKKKNQRKRKNEKLKKKKEKTEGNPSLLSAIAGLRFVGRQRLQNRGIVEVYNEKHRTDVSATPWLAKVLSRDSCGEMNEHDMCGHVLGAMVLEPASRVRQSETVEQQARMLRWAADLQVDVCAQFAEIPAMDQFVGADHAALSMARTFGQVHARHWGSFPDGQTAGLLQQGFHSEGDHDERDVFINWPDLHRLSMRSRSRVCDGEGDHA